MVQMRSVGVAGLVGLAALSPFAHAQICNSRDPGSGGVLIPAFSFGEVVTCACDPANVAAEVLGSATPGCLQDHLGNYLDPTVLPALCAARTDNNAETGCEAVRPVKNLKITSCKWNQTLADDGTCSVTTHTTEAACTTAGATWTADAATDPCQPYLEQEWGCQCSEFPAVLAANSDAECVPSENDPQGGIAVIYCFLLLLSFSGVGIIADVFMEAIAVITSSSTLLEKKEDKSGETHQIEVMTWNATVANLTLMALGSSAPEILLSVIEIIVGKFYSGELGPSTIVGSAAFNMLVILGICVMCIPEANEKSGETGERKIADTGVFAITAVSSVFAYIWLLIILMMVTPNVVDLWESLLTFLFFPILVIMAYAMDAGMCSKNKVAPGPGTITGVAQDGVQLETFRPNEVKSLLKAEGHRDVLSTDPANIEALAEAAYFKSKPKTRADYRIEATRELTGSKPMHATEALGDGEGRERRSWIGWQCTDMRVKEVDAEAVITVVRAGNNSYPVSFKIATESGTATAGEDFKHVEETLTLAAGQDSVSTKIPINNDDKEEDDEQFTVRISDVSERDVEIEAERTTCAITIVDDATPSVLQMAETEEEGLTASYKCFESDGRVLVKVERTGGCSTAASCQYATKEGTATGDMDYVETSGTLEFGPGETCKYVDIKIIDDDQYETDEEFTLTISDPVGATLGGVKTATIIIVNDDEMTDVVERVSNLLKLNMDKYKVGSANYKAQFTDAVEVPDGVGAKISHFLNLPFKLLFAICPPPGICGGYLCFIISLGLIGVTTAVIGDLAALFGCSVGLKDAVTAITFVALGTSLPDTFASKAAAIGDKTADASIGNVTGSNSVNVFLGLGTPWLMASVYWMTNEDSADWNAWLLEQPDARITPAHLATIEGMACFGEGGCFVVPAGDLGFSVIIFAVCAVCCLGGLVLRRKLYGCELGGKAQKPFGFFFISLWFVYVVLSTMKCYAII